MKRFRTIEFSDSRFQKEGLRFVTVKSNNLKGRGDVILFIPEKISKNCAVTILLHGVYGSAWSWPMSGGVHLIEKAKTNPMVLAFPSDGLWGDGSGYVPHDGFDFEKWIAEDIPELLIEIIPEITTDSLFFVTGLSMGGFGALRIGAKYHQRFKSFSGHSSITHLQQMQLFVEEDISHYTHAGVDDQGVFETIKKNKNKIGKFRFDCGTSDLLLEHNRRLHECLKSENIQHTYEEFSGGHEWSYWQKHIERSLDFFRNQIPFKSTF